LNVQQAAKWLSKSESTIRRWIRQGKLTASLIDGVYDIPLSSLNERSSGSQMADNDRSQIAAMGAQIELLRRENDRLAQQLDVKDRQISGLHDLLLIAERRIEQLVDYQQLPFWRRLFRRKPRPSLPDY